MYSNQVVAILKALINPLIKNLESTFKRNLLAINQSNNMESWKL